MPQRQPVWDHEDSLVERERERRIFLPLHDDADAVLDRIVARAAAEVKEAAAARERARASVAARERARASAAASPSAVALLGAGAWVGVAAALAANAIRAALR